jgi:hypothetical protein
VRLTAQGRALRSQTKVLTQGLDAKSGMSIEALIALNGRIQALRDAFRAP